MKYFIGVDIGGTFTDCVLMDVAGNHKTTKTLSTKAAPGIAVMEGLQQLAESENLSLEELLKNTIRVGHGTTIGTNAVLERAGSRVGLISTAGHGDAVSLMRGSGRVAGKSVEELFLIKGSNRPEPITVPGAILEVDERIDAAGEIVVELNVASEVERVKKFVVQYELDSLAIMLLWSFKNPKHELELSDAIKEALPGIFVSISYEVSPRLGEYERAVATLLNAYVGPACSTYVTELEDELAENSFQEPLLVMQSNGGLLPAKTAIKSSLGTIDSGPSGGLTGVVTLAKTLGHKNVIATDMGGTSFDIGLVIDGKPVMAEENIIDQYTYRLPHLDVRTVACGGGTIAYYDDTTGALKVGPQSAGSEPGPVSYGRGGTQPTVTDSDVVLGFLRSDGFLDGRMPLDEVSAREAMSALGDQLRLSTEETAAGILSINNLRAATLIRRQTLQRGYDPRDFILYAYGGAGPLHAYGFAKEAGISEVVIPLGNGASTLSAFGIATGDTLIYEETEVSFSAPFEGDVAEELGKAIEKAEASARDALEQMGVNGEINVHIEALMRFKEQLLHALEVPVTTPVTAATGQDLVDSFDAEYSRRYGQGGTQLFQAIEVFTIRVRAAVSADVPQPKNSAIESPDVREVEVYWPGEGNLTTKVVSGEPVQPVAGPALVELAHTTIAIPPGARLDRGAADELRLILTESEG